jgi:hypothetical protein
MSHFVNIQTQIKDIDALKSACAELSLTVEQNAQARGFGTQTQAGEYVIRLQGPYDIALNRQANGSYSLSTDWWEGHVEKEVGKNYGRLLQLYAVHKATREAQKRGVRVHRTALPNGAIKLLLSGGAI